MADRHEILEALEKILTQPGFSTSQQLSSFLSYVINQKLEGNEENLKAYTIAVDALGKPTDFDPQKDPIVRVLAGRLRNHLELYYLDRGAQDKVRIHIPKGTYKPDFVDVQAEQSSIAHTDTPAPQPAQSSGVGWIITSIAALGIMVSAVFFRFHGDVESTAQVSRAPLVAIAEFESNSNDPDMEKFVYGLRFDLISELSRFSWLSTFARDAKVDGKIRKIRKSRRARRSVDYILHGSVNITKERIYMSFRLESADTGIVRWVQDFDRKFTAKNIFEIQRQAVMAIAIKVGNPDGVLRQIEQGRYPIRTGGLSAYACTLRTYHYWKTFLEKDHLESRECLEDAVKTDPLYADAHAALAYMYLDEYLYGFNRREGYDPVERGARSAEHAAKLDQFSILAKQAVFASKLYGGNVEEFIRIGERAIELSPNNPRLLADFGNKLALNAGYWKEGEKYIDKALQLNSNPSPWYYTASAFVAIHHQDYERALSQLALMKDPGWINFRMIDFIAQANLKNLPAVQEDLKDLTSKGVGDFETLSRQIKAYRFHPDFEAELINHVRSAFEFAKGMS